MKWWMWTGLGVVGLLALRNLGAPQARDKNYDWAEQFLDTVTTKAYGYVNGRFTVNDSGVITMELDRSDGTAVTFVGLPAELAVKIKPVT